MSIARHARRLLVLIAAAVLVLGCADKRSSEPPRPAAVPEAAVWVGGADGGVFVVLRGPAAGTPAAYAGSVYHPDGSIWYSGPFRLQPADAKPVDPQAQGLLSGWDGTRLLLEDGRSLVATAGK